MSLEERVHMLERFLYAAKHTGQISFRSTGHGGCWGRPCEDCQLVDDWDEFRPAEPADK